MILYISPGKPFSWLWMFSLVLRPSAAFWSASQECPGSPTSSGTFSWRSRGCYQTVRGRICCAPAWRWQCRRWGGRWHSWRPCGPLEHASPRRPPGWTGRGVGVIWSSGSEIHFMFKIFLHKIGFFSPLPPARGVNDLLLPKAGDVPDPDQWESESLSCWRYGQGWRWQPGSRWFGIRHMT